MKLRKVGHVAMLSDLSQVGRRKSCQAERGRPTSPWQQERVVSNKQQPPVRYRFSKNAFVGVELGKNKKQNLV